MVTKMAKTRFLNEMLANTRRYTVVVKIENDYEDGHHSESIHALPAPSGDLDEWWEEVVYPNTGDGHGVGFDGGSCYTAEIISGPTEVLGKSTEWID